MEAGGEPFGSSGRTSSSADAGAEAGTRDGTAGSDEPPSSSTGTILHPGSAHTPRPLGETAAELGYWEYLPPDYGTEEAPLLVFFHGAMWTGDGSLDDLQTLLTVGPPAIIDAGAWPETRPFVVLSPQYSGGCPTAETVSGFLDYAVSAYRVDPARVYLTGQSCGAMGVWTYLGEHLGEQVAAAVPISGDGRDAFAAAGCALSAIPLWGFHNDEDPVVPAAGTTEPVTALMACDSAADVRLTVYPGEEHDAWTQTYDLSAGYDIYAWMLEHSH